MATGAFTKDVSWIGTQEDLVRRLTTDHPGRYFTVLPKGHDRYLVTVYPEGVGPDEKTGPKGETRNAETPESSYYGTIIHYGQAYRVYGPPEHQEVWRKGLVGTDGRRTFVWIDPNLRVERV